MKRLTSPSTFSRFASLNSSIQKTPCATCSLRRMLHSYRAQRQPQTTHSIAINREHSRRVDARLHHGLNPRSSRIPLRARLQNQQPRRTTTTSTTAVRASAHARTSVDVPPWLRGVHAALKRLERDAATYVPVSQLHLALQGLEVPSAPIRIAVLALACPLDTVRTLVRVLLADPLTDRQEWEDELGTMEAGGGVGEHLLVKYGEETEFSNASGPIPILRIPAPMLRDRNIELLLSSANLLWSQGSASAQLSMQDLLTPLVPLPRSSRGGMSNIHFPVHRCLIVTQGIKGCMALGPLYQSARSELVEKGGIVHGGINFAGPPASDFNTPESIEGLTMFNVQEAATALDLLRASNENALLYERGWHASGVATIASWLNGLSRDATIQSTTEHLLTSTASNILREEEARARVSARSATIDSRRAAQLERDISRWSVRAHSDLQHELSIAFASLSWAKLRGARVLWRADDVHMVATELLERSWLVKAEKGAAWLAGRNSSSSDELGLDSVLALPGSSTGTNTGPGSEAGPAPLPPSQTQGPASDSNVNDSYGEAVPWPRLIASSRAELRGLTVPTLVARAQSLVLQTASVMLTSTGISALLHISFSAAGVYEAGAIAAIGTVWALRRLQKQWEAARKSFSAQLYSRGRQVLGQVEDRARVTASAAPATALTAVAEIGGAEDQARARAAVDEARVALDGAAGRKK